jgi:hypothetical protein
VTPEERRETLRVLVEKHKSKSLLEERSVNGKTLLKCVLNRYYKIEWIGFIWLRTCILAESSGRSNKMLSSIEFGDFRVKLSIC